MEYIFAEEFEFILTSLLQISEKILVCRSLLKVGDNYWMQEEPEHTGEGDYVDAFVQELELDESAIMEASLCDNSKFVAFIAKTFQIEKIICQLCSILMTSHNKHSVSRKEVYLDRGSLT